MLLCFVRCLHTPVRASLSCASSPSIACTRIRMKLCCDRSRSGNTIKRASSNSRSTERYRCLSLLWARLLLRWIFERNKSGNKMSCYGHRWTAPILRSTQQPFTDGLGVTCGRGQTATLRIRREAENCPQQSFRTYPRPPFRT